MVSFNRSDYYKSGNLYVDKSDDLATPRQMLLLRKMLLLLVNPFNDKKRKLKRDLLEIPR